MSDSGDIPWSDGLAPTDPATPTPYYGPLSPDYAFPGDSAYSGGGGSGFNVDTFGRALQYGVDAYGKIVAIQHSGASQYDTPPGTGVAPPAPSGNLPAPAGANMSSPSSSSSTFMQKLTDFSTPVPYAAGLVGIVVLLTLVRAARR